MICNVWDDSLFLFSLIAVYHKQTLTQLYLSKFKSVYSVPAIWDLETSLQLPDTTALAKYFRGYFRLNLEMLTEYMYHLYSSKNSS